MGNTSSAIKNAYQEYRLMIEHRKKVQASPIRVADKKDNRADIGMGRVGVLHVGLKRQMHLEIEVKITDISNFKFKLYCRSNFQSPIFRYDSTGPDHRNSKNTLKEQRVSTPHFHSFNSNGIEIAFKTKALLRNPQAYVKIQPSLDHFCNEGNLRYQKGFPVVALFPNQFPFHSAKQDPLENVKF